MRTLIALSFKDARTIADACLKQAQADGRNVCIAVADEAGALLALARMDGARSYAVDLASRKARVAALVGAPTSVIEAMQRERPTGPELAVTQGGLPVVHEGQCAGAVGVSGGKPEEDERIARAGIEALKPG